MRDNADSAAAATISPARAKLLAFALAGGIAGFAGAMLGGLLSTISFTEVFTVSDSIQVLSIAVIGGIGSVAGPILGALWVVGLPSFWPDSSLIPLLTSSIGLLVLLMYFPGGLVQLWFSTRDALFAFVERKLPDQETAAKQTAVPDVRRPAARRAASGERQEIALSGSNVSVSFGARMVVNDVSLTVHDGEVVGLIGTNGAGKTTLMNAIGGFVPADGLIMVGEHDVSGLSPARRARAGLGRTFQSARLYPDLSVRETVQVALEAQFRTGFAATASMLPRGFAVERRQHAEALSLIHFLGLGRYADRLTAELSTGTRRIVELACLLAVGARVLCLDEPTAGVAQREAEAFAPLIVRIREELGASVLIIEHDMPLIMSISDRVYCLEAGAVIVEGTPEELRNDAAVIASYLGTDDRAIERSGAAGATRATTVPGPN